MTQITEKEVASPDQSGSPIYRRLQRLVNVEPEEIKALFWAFSYFFAILCGYYIVRPIRDEMGIAGGIENLPWMFTGTFLVMLAAVPFFGWVTSRYPRKQFLPYIYGFFISNLLLFFGLFTSDITHAYVARAFYIWASVFNLFIISIFWSFMADIFDTVQAKRLFGFIAAGGTAGALLGPMLTALLVVPLGAANLLILSAVFLGWPILCFNRLIAWREKLQAVSPDQNEPEKETDALNMGGSIFAGIHLVLRSPYLMGICLLILLLSTLATFLYFQQLQIIRDNFSDGSERTRLFAAMDFVTNALTIILQVFLTGRIVNRLGTGWTLAVIPIGLGVGFLILGFSPVLAVLIVVQVLRRAGNYAIMRPAREMLYVVLGKEEKYKAKNFIDTVVYRGGDAVSSWVYPGLQSLGLSLGGIAFVAVPLCGLWAWTSLKLGRKQEKMAGAGR
jgi:AAA family ATP:ADP antiporter